MSEQTSQAGDEMYQKDDQIAHHRIVAGQKIPTNYGRNNNSPATPTVTAFVGGTEAPAPKLAQTVLVDH
jgi:hypothetical protein